MGQYTETPGTERGGVSVQKVSRKGYRKGVLVQDGGGGSCAGRGFLWGSCGTSCAHPALTILGRLPFEM